jgi:nucleoside-diphosphate-sugar epimerase
MRVLVTGATGSFGTPICRHLHTEVCRGVGDGPPRIRSIAHRREIRLWRCARCGQRSSRGRGHRRRDAPSVLVASAKDSGDAGRINVDGTQNVLDAMRAQTVPVSSSPRP